MITKTRVSIVAMLLILGLSIWYMFSAGLHIRSIGARQASVIVSDTNGLLVGSRVLLRGIEIGTVTDISQTSDGAKITWEYGKKYSIPVESRYRIDNLSALGEGYVGIWPESDAEAVLVDNQVVDSSYVDDSSTFNDLSKQVVEVLDQVDPELVQNVFYELDRGLPEQQDVIGDLNHAGVVLVEQLSYYRQSLDRLLSSVQPVIMAMDSVPAGLQGATPHLRNFGKMFAYLEDGVKDAIDWSGPMYTGITEGAGPLIETLQRFLDRSADDIEVIGRNLDPVTESIADLLYSVIPWLGNAGADPSMVADGELSLYLPVDGN